MAATDEMRQIAMNLVPYSCCIVPEKRQELTTEGGLDVAHNKTRIKELIEALHSKNIIVSLFIDPDKEQVEAAAEAGSDYIELHTGAFSNAFKKENEQIEFNKLKEAGYKVGILIAPIILVENWKEEYEKLIQYLAENLSEKVKKEAFFELIFMTYSYVHNAINTEAFPNRPNLYDKEQMTGRGKGKYMYKHEVREEAEKEIRAVMKQYFPNNEIKYIV